MANNNTKKIQHTKKIQQATPIKKGEGPTLHVYCHVSGGFVFGSAPLRYKIFQGELPLVLEALRYGDRSFFAARPQLDKAPI
jgi:hypothetical protein